ncbi:MAG: hypothetical protein KGZ37_04960 [Nitrosarchaeum sp.]|nr:hypothetical protein [Nitrosarchaeum sp.]
MISSSVTSFTEKVVAFSNGTFICLRCLQTFDQEKWRKHQRKIQSSCPGYSTHDNLSALGMTYA